MVGIYAHGHFGDLDLDARYQWVSKVTKISVELSTTEQAISIKLAATIGLFFFYVTLTFKTLIWLDQLVIAEASASVQN